MFRKATTQLSLWVVIGVISFYARVLKLKNWKKWTEETLCVLHGIIWYFIPSALLWRLFING